ncbi:MAG: phosphate-starvation-inducible PsiE family protein [Rhodocyclaceae bacterium]|nr:phosphate-starvation-inducible PsiE family protein [Rhodocyclaceae bacterium]MBX3667121.1 phosphate-starvation-inducible PsiE family protein [Rhodocyclaceae bacterium]
MEKESPAFSRIRRALQLGVDAIEHLGLLAIVVATSVAMLQEVMVMLQAHHVQLSDLLLLFLFLEVLAMVGQYYRTGQLPVRFPLYIAMVSLARYLILDVHDLEEWRILAVSVSILLLTVAVLVVRYGHIRFPYEKDKAERGKAYVRE